MTLKASEPERKESLLKPPVRIGMDTAKNVFQLHGVDEAEGVVLRRQMRRDQMIRYFEQLPPTLVAIESCGASIIRADFFSRLATR